MKAADVMTKDVITVRPEAPVREIAALMTEKRISGVPVVGADGRLIGILSETDLLHRAETGTERQRKWWLGMFQDADSMARAYAKAHGLKAGDIMTTTIVTVGANTELHEVADLLEKRKLKRVPVVEDGRLVGMITRGDLVRALAGVKTMAPTQSDDRTLLKAIDARMRAQPWLNANMIAVSVENGVAELRGLVPSADQQRALRILVEETPGLVRVEDNLTVHPIIMSA